MDKVRKWTFVIGSALGKHEDPIQPVEPAGRKIEDLQKIQDAGKKVDNGKPKAEGGAAPPEKTPDTPHSPTKSSGQGKRRERERRRNAARATQAKRVAEAAKQAERVAEAARQAERAAEAARQAERAATHVAKLPLTAEARLATKVRQLAFRSGALLKNQGGFARIGVINIIAIATVAGIILTSEDALDAVLQVSAGIAWDMGIAALLMKFGKVSGGMAFIITGVLGMKSDQGEKIPTLYDIVDGFISENFPNLDRNSSEYGGVFTQLVHAYISPYVLVKHNVPTSNLERARAAIDAQRYCAEEEDELSRNDCFQNVPMP